MDVVGEFIEKWAKMLDYLQFFQEGNPIREQLGVVRTNCLDSLDRTNVIQARLAWRSLIQQFGFYKIDPNMYYSGDGKAFSAKFRSLWSDNGNHLSIQYSGTDSTTSAITKDGKSGILGSISSGISSVGRFFKNNFGDELRQKCIDCLLGKEFPNSKIIVDQPPIDVSNLRIRQDDVEEKLQEKIEIQQNDLKFFIGIWNLAGGIPDSTIDISKWIGATETP